MLTTADLKYIEPTLLKSWMVEKHTGRGGNFIVVDVRDSDYIGGHIREGWHIPSSEIGRESSNILAQLRKGGIDSVVFHCALSQQRGPSSAMRFLRYLRGVIDDPKASDGEREFVENIQVYVLRGGFIKWQELYGEDAELTEAYQRWMYE